MDQDDIPQIDNPISVFPKPQRMYSEEERVPGGQYLNARTKEDMTGHKAAVASIGVHHGGKPYFLASQEAVDQTGSPGKGSATVKTNLFKQKAGWKWLNAPEGHEDTHTIVSVEHRGSHNYALNAHFPKGVDFARYENSPSEPRLRPTTKGNLQKGNQVGSISVRGKEHPVYDHIIVKNGGGEVDTDGITAYHGSPHDFEKFDTSKIGTGEGAQAYGHGLYFAQAEPVAQGYKQRLAKIDASEADKIGISPSNWNAFQMFARQTDENLPEVAARDFSNWTGHPMSDDLVEAYRKTLKNRGHMYEVHINAHPHHFLDWDKPLSEQSEHVQKALDSLQSHPDWTNNFKNELKRVRGTNYFDGNDLYRELIKAKNAPEISQMLHGFGIKGIKYLDAGSRGDKAEPTHNYVVFDHNDVNIKRKYEQGGRVGFDIGGAVPETPTLAGVQSFFDQANLVNQQKDAAQEQAAYQQQIAANQQADAAAKAAAAANKPKEGFGNAIEVGGGGGEGGGGGGFGAESGGPDGSDSPGGEWRGGRIDYNTGGPVNVSKAEDSAGNFKKEHEKIHGIPVAIEVKEGHDRVKYKPNGKLKFKAKQYADYGAILGTKDADGMNTDVMVGPHKDSQKAYIIDQKKYDSGKFDEHKVMLGFNKRKKAVKAYTKSYADRHGKERVQDVIKTDIKGLKKWLKHGNLDKPASKDALIKSALSVVSKKT